MIKMDFLPDDLAESLIPYEPEDLPTVENSGDSGNTNHRVEFVIRNEELPTIGNANVMPIDTMEISASTGVLPVDEIAMATQTGMLPVDEVDMVANTGVLPTDEIAMATQTGMLPVDELAMATSTGVLPVDAIAMGLASDTSQFDKMAFENYQADSDMGMSGMDLQTTEPAIQEMNEAEYESKKIKKSREAAKTSMTGGKKKRGRRRISPSTMKESYVELNDNEGETADISQQDIKAEKLTSSYVEKKSSPFKNKFKYTVIVVPENTKGHFRPVYLGYTLVNVILGILLVLFVILFIANTTKGIKLSSLKAENEKMQATIDSMETNMVYLTSANAGLSDKVAVLSETVNQKSGELENYVKDEESKMTPTGFPFAGQAAMLESTETAKDAKITLGGESESKKNSERKPGYDLEGYPITIFSASKGTRIIATANGKVKEVAADLCFGNRVAIEHSNGMVSIYRCSSTPKVSEKQEVKQGDTIYEAGSESEKLGYQIIKDNGYIDPLEMMEIFG